MRGVLTIIQYAETRTNESKLALCERHVASVGSRAMGFVVAVFWDWLVRVAFCLEFLVFEAVVGSEVNEFKE